MTLQAGLNEELPFLRTEARGRMVDTFDFGVPTGGYHYDEGVGKDVETLTPLFSSPGYISTSAGVLSQASEVGGRTMLTARREICIPWDSDAIPANAVAVCSAISPTTPPRMLGKRYRVGGSDGASQGVMCHVEITEDLS